MPTIPAGYGQVNFKFGGLGWPNKGECTMGFENTSAGDAFDVATAIIDIYNGTIDQNVPAAVTLDSVLVKLGPNDTGPQAEIGVGSAGTGDGTQVQPNMAVLVNKLTSLGGRHGRGRLYWPISEGVVDTGGLVQAAYVTALNGNFADFMTEMTAADLSLRLLHTGAAPGPTTITSLVAQAIASTQRRRLRR